MTQAASTICSFKSSLPTDGYKFFTINGSPRELPTPTKHPSPRQHKDIIVGGLKNLDGLTIDCFLHPPCKPQNNTCGSKPTTSKSTKKRGSPSNDDPDYDPGNRGRNKRPKRKKTSKPMRPLVPPATLSCAECNREYGVNDMVTCVKDGHWPLPCDISYEFTCGKCVCNGSFTRGRKDWQTVVKIVLYNLQKARPKGKFSFRDIKTYTEKNWDSLNPIGSVHQWEQSLLDQLRKPMPGVSQQGRKQEQWTLSNIDDFENQVKREREIKNSNRLQIDLTSIRPRRHSISAPICPPQVSLFTSGCRSRTQRSQTLKQQDSQPKPLLPKIKMLSETTRQPSKPRSESRIRVQEIVNVNSSSPRIELGRGVWRPIELPSFFDSPDGSSNISYDGFSGSITASMSYDEENRDVDDVDDSNVVFCCKKTKSAFSRTKGQSVGYTPVGHVTQPLKSSDGGYDAMAM
mmetsp:Transcript_12589/g.14010  ORF Transcript_12589/g.14010 Transcript_12589/m.14010 type:complete len:459 (-) Transcript_12589:184-1560(-)